MLHQKDTTKVEDSLVLKIKAKFIIRVKSHGCATSSSAAILFFGTLNLKMNTCMREFS
jgi:hypothetical protein